MRIGAFGGTSLASGTDALLSEQRLAGGSSALAAVARRFRQRSRYPGDSGWTPADLFAANEVGVWYDPNDLRTLYQDSTGVTPVTDVGQPVGLVLDKARWDGRGVVNLVRSSEDFTAAAGWALVNVTISSQTTITETTATGSHGVAVATIAAPIATITVDAIAGSRTWLRISTREGGSSRHSYFDIGNGVVGTIPTATGSQPYRGTISALSGGGYRCTLIGPSTAFSSGLGIGLATGDNVLSYTGDGTSGLTVLRVQYELGSQPTEYQKNSGSLGGGGNALTQSTATSRPTLEYDSATGAYYLAFDGTDDSLLSTSALDLSGSSTVSVFAGARKQSDATQGVLVEQTTNATTVAGGLLISAPGTTPGTNLYQMVSRGSAAATANATASLYAAPHSAVFSMVADIATDTLTGRLNGTQALTSSTDQGTGNRANAVLYVGRRNNAAFPFNGRVYGLAVRGATSDAATVSEAEQWLSRRVGVSLP